jgi:hypothetical protein
MQNRTLFSLIGERYLDTQHGLDYIERIEAELRRRRVVGFKRIVCEYLAASSLWWNILWWDWEDLNERDIKLGWTQNFIIFGIIGACVGLFSSWFLALTIVTVLHLITLKIGLSFRQETKPNKAIK